MGVEEFLDELMPELGHSNSGESLCPAHWSQYRCNFATGHEGWHFDPRFSLEWWPVHNIQLERTGFLLRSGPYDHGILARQVKNWGSGD